MNASEIIQVTPDWLNSQLIVETYDGTETVSMIDFCEFHRKGWDLTGVSNFEMIDTALDFNYTNFDMNELMAEYLTSKESEHEPRIN